MNGKDTILAVDDTTESLALLGQILTAAGYAVRLADSGELGLAAVAVHRPDLILLDIRMPGLDGLEVCRRLQEREETRTIPVILMSASDGVTDWVEGLKLGAVDYIRKPLQAEELRHRVRTHLALSQAKNLGQEALALRQAKAQLEAEIAGRRQAEAGLRRSLEAGQRSEAALRESEERYRRITEGVTDSSYDGVIKDITERKRLEEEREITLELLLRINAAVDLRSLMREITRLLRDWTGCEAIGIRLRQGEDFPYYETSGFPAAFVRLENYLCATGPGGELLRDGQGHPVLDCMCGNVLCGRFDPRQPFFTPRGSFWANSTTRLLATTTEADRRARTRNRCHGEGYESVALVAVRAGGEVFGLLQFNDRRPDRFTLERILLFERLADCLALALAHRRAEEALRQTRERLELAQRSAGAGVWGWDIPGARLEWSRELFGLFGLNPDQTPASLETWRQALHPEDRAEAAARLERAVQDGVPLVNEYRVVWPTGQVRWISALGRTVYDADRRPVSMSGICLDITERKEAEEKIRRALAEKEVLLKEIHHRVKNNLQIVSGLLRLQHEGLLDPQLRETLKESQSRIRSMALVHEKLYQSPDLARLDFKAYAQSLAAQLFRVHLAQGRVVRFTLRMAETALELNAAIPCGLLLNELISNALKHAFRADRPSPENEITLAWDDLGARWRITFADNGGGLAAGVDWTQPRTLGLRLVRMLVQQLRGEIRLEAGSGCRFVIEFPKAREGKG